MFARSLRLTWAIATFLVAEGVVWGLSVVPSALLFSVALASETYWLRLTIVALVVFPAYLLFAFMFAVLSAIAMRIAGWRTPPNARMPIRDLDWDLLTWLRYVAGTHLVRIFAGTLFRATPVWTFYLRLNGARVGRRVYVNSLAIVDHNLLEFSEGTVIGADVHLSGHTVEHGVILTGPVRTGRNVTLGTSSVISIDVEIGDDAQVGALSFVPKHSHLRANTVYVGIPVHSADAVTRA
jgi:acetyltransferase-like isoleucine patch superfamily enzyme